MEVINYLDFDLLIERSPKGYRARVLSSPAGQAAADFRLPFSELEIENFLLRIGRTRRGVRRLESPEMEAAKTFGGHLFEAVFDKEVRGCLRSSLDEANRRGAGLRIRLRLTDVPELADLPWEYLHNPTVNRFLVLSAETPLVRYLDLPEPIRPLAVKPPLRILVMIASPNDYPPLDVEREWAKLKEALDDLEQRGLLALERLEPATLTALQRRLRRGEYHIFHFVGHGAFDERAQDGLLLLEDEGGRGRAVSGQYLGTLMHDERTLRLAILNACEGARTSRSDPFAGAAQTLVQQGIPAVIAMQSEITDEAAIALAHEFYAALADGYPVDAALAEARKAIFAQGNDVEWGKPVLYLRSPDGILFDIQRGTLKPQPPSFSLTPEPEPLKSSVVRTWFRRLPPLAWAGLLGLLLVLGVVAVWQLVGPAPPPAPMETVTVAVKPIASPMLTVTPTTAPTPTTTPTPTPPQEPELPPCTWTDHVSEETGPVYCQSGYALKGVRCKGSYCDNKELYCCPYMPSVDPEAHYDWSPWISEESSNNSYNTSSGFLAGLECKNDYCDNVRMRVLTTRNLRNLGQCSYRPYISEEGMGKMICEDGFFVAGMKCSAEYCDNVSLMCCRSK